MRGVRALVDPLKPEVFVLCLDTREQKIGRVPLEVPIVVIVLARLGMVSIEKLKAFRSYFIVLAFVIAAVITPPDVVSQLALAIPMCLLYEVGIWAAQIFIKHTKAPEEEATSPTQSS